jgi:hypothetical protein
MALVVAGGEKVGSPCRQYRSSCSERTIDQALRATYTKTVPLTFASFAFMQPHNWAVMESLAEEVQPMSDALNRAERYRDLAEECRHLAKTSLSAQMRNRFSRMAEDYSTLAEGRTSLRRLGAMARLTERIRAN